MKDGGADACPGGHARVVPLERKETPCGATASIALDGEVLAGSLLPRALRLVRDWAALHGAELEANWTRALVNDGLKKIEPLP